MANSNLLSFKALNDLCVQAWKKTLSSKTPMRQLRNRAQMELSQFLHSAKFENAFKEDLTYKYILLRSGRRVDIPSLSFNDDYFKTAQLELKMSR